MDYLYALVTLAAAMKAFSYARWLKQEGQGALSVYGIYVLVFMGLAISGYRLFRP